MADHMTAPGSDVRGNVLPSGLRDDPAPSPGCYRVVMREPTHGWTVRPIVDADNPEQAIDKSLNIFPNSVPGRFFFLHTRGPHSSTERFLVGWDHLDRRRRVA